MENDQVPTHATAHQTVQVDDTLIIGAGPAGLAVGACLQRAGVPFVILEQSDKVGAKWHEHYHRLHLHTSKELSGLPFFPFPRHYPRYPSRQQVIDYLEAYAQHFGLEPRFGQRVVSAQYDQHQWEVRTEDVIYVAPRLIVATGVNREPHIPVWPGQASYRGTVLHSSQYRNGAQFEDKQVLVIGFGNSGGEIALDLWEHGARPSIAVRSPVNVIPRDLLGIPVLAIALLQRSFPARLVDAINAPLERLTIGDLTRYGLRKLPYGPVTQTRQHARIPVIDVGTLELIKRGYLQVYPGVERFTETGVVFTDQREQAFDAVILATGFRPRVHAFLKGASDDWDEEGRPSCSGREASLPGLYFCGFYISPTGMFREIALEAKRIGADITRKKLRVPLRKDRAIAG